MWKVVTIHSLFSRATLIVTESNKIQILFDKNVDQIVFVWYKYRNKENWR